MVGDRYGLVDYPMPGNCGSGNKRRAARRKAETSGIVRQAGESSKPVVVLQDVNRRLILTLGMTLATGSILADPPGVSYTAELRQQLDAGLQLQGGDYQPRTIHIDPDGRPLYTNRLILQDSPYLMQHAHNPVDWYPWGPEAFAPG